MPKEVLFFENGVELTIEVEGDNAIALLTIRANDDMMITHYFDKERLTSFRESIELANYYLDLLEKITKHRTEKSLKISSSRILKIIKEEIKKNWQEDKPELWPEYKLSALLNLNRIEADVFIGLPEKKIDLFTIERIQNATGDFMEAMGFELETQDEPVLGSFFQKLKYLLKGEVQKEASEIYGKGKAALEAQFIDLPSAEATDKLASASAALITSLNGVSDAAIRCGSILLVKVTKDGIPKVVIETVSPELAALLNKNPSLLQNPTIVFDLISGMRAPDRTIEESEKAKLIE